MIDGVEYKTGMGLNKKEARVKAAQLAVEELLANLENDVLLPEASGKVKICGTLLYFCCAVAGNLLFFLVDKF